MSLSDLDLKAEYRNQQCNVVEDFYFPTLKEAIIYKRAVGFFNSSALTELIMGIKSLISRGGKIQIIASPQLNEEDIKDIRDGYERRKEIVERAIVRTVDEISELLEIRKLSLLSTLIENKVLDIKIAFKLNCDYFGIFHEKLGILEDDKGNKVAFTGSMNETFSGLFLNYESIDVYCSWKSKDEERVLLKEDMLIKKSLKILVFLI